MKEEFRKYGKLCWVHKIEYDIAGACMLFAICTATLRRAIEGLAEYSQSEKDCHKRKTEGRMTFR